MSWKIRWDPIRCTAHGYCAEILPERIALDDWGYPIIGSDPLGPELQDHARRAVSECPVRALKLERLAQRSGHD